MYRGTTPTLIFDLSANKTLVFDNFDEVWVTLKKGVYEVTWDLAKCVLDSVAKTISITLTQEETLALPKPVVNAQIRILLNNGSALATNIAEIDVNEILKEGVIE